MLERLVCLGRVEGFQMARIVGLQALEDCRPAAVPPISSGKCLCQLLVRANAEERMAHQSTPPWSVLGSIVEAKIRAREIQADQWCANTKESSSWRVSCRGEVDVLLRENMAFTPGFVT